MDKFSEAFDLVYADTYLVLANKPAGLLSVPGRGPDKQDCLISRVQVCFADALVVHRLDMATSGLLLMARGPVAQRLLSVAFAQRQVRKRYVAVVQGRPEDAYADTEGWSTIDLPLAADWPRRPLQKVDPVVGKPSTTRWRLLSWDPKRNCSRLELEPLTGRSHQLRVHLQAIGHPILGDALYAQGEALAAAPRLLLHAQALALNHPASGESLTFEVAAAF